MRPALAVRLLLCLLALCALPAAATGTVIAIGGALRDGNAAVWQRVVQAAGGEGARIVVIATASQTPEATGWRIAAQLQRHGARAEPFRDSLQIDAASGVFFAGGVQARLLDALQPGGRQTPVLAAVRALLARGGVVAGTSSGAAVLSRHAFRDVPDPFAALTLPLRDGQEVDRGFALLPSHVVVDQHFLKRGRIGRLLPMMLSRGATLGLGVEEDSAAVVRGDELEVLGARGVLVVDLADARTDAAVGGFNLRGARLSFLTPGDRYDLARREARITRPEASRLGGRRETDAADRFFADILGDGTIVTAMTRLVEGSGDEVTGLAFRPGQPRGFQWRLSKGPGTAGWAGEWSDDATLVNVRLDVLPVRMARPLFQPINP